MWQAHETTTDEVHVMPANDHIDHLFVDCPCGTRDEPVLRDGGSVAWVIRHNSLDGRERFE